MSEFLNNMNRRKQHLERGRGDAFANRRSFCIENLPQLARDAVERIVAAYAVQYDNPDVQYKESAEDRDNYIPLYYGGDNHAAWEIATWPPHEIPERMTIESYKVYLLDNAQIVSVTSFWDERRQPRLEPYDPYRYETPALNVASVYFKIAELPGDPSFMEESMKRLQEADRR